jgi:hypothetical protein
MSNIEDLIKTQYISLDSAQLRVFVDDVDKFEPVFNLHKYDHIEYTGGSVEDIIPVFVPDKEKRAKYNIPSFVEDIAISSDKTFGHCLIISVNSWYDINLLHDWISNYLKQDNNE